MLCAEIRLLSCDQSPAPPVSQRGKFVLLVTRLLRASRNDLDNIVKLCTEEQHERISHTRIQVLELSVGIKPCRNGRTGQARFIDQISLTDVAIFPNLLLPQQCRDFASVRHFHCSPHHNYLHVLIVYLHARLCQVVDIWHIIGYYLSIQLSVTRNNVYAFHIYKGMV